MNKRLLSILMACVAIPMIHTPLVKAAENTEGKADRTILLYDCGADLETESGMASYNLRQILKANFSEGEKVKFVVMTGGAGKWHLESEYLCDPDNKGLDARPRIMPDGPGVGQRRRRDDRTVRETLPVPVAFHGTSDAACPYDDRRPAGNAELFFPVHGFGFDFKTVHRGIFDHSCKSKERAHAA